MCARSYRNFSVQRYVSLDAKMEELVFHLIHVPVLRVGVETHVHKVCIKILTSFFCIHCMWDNTLTSHIL